MKDFSSWDKKAFAFYDHSSQSTHRLSTNQKYFF